MLNETQQIWLTELPETEFEKLFVSLRKESLDRLDSAQANYETGKLVQDEVSALHRIERRLKDLRSQALKQTE